MNELQTLQVCVSGLLLCQICLILLYNRLHNKVKETSRKQEMYIHAQDDFNKAQYLMMKIHGMKLGLIETKEQEQVQEQTNMQTDGM